VLQAITWPRLPWPDPGSAWDGGQRRPDSVTWLPTLTRWP